MALIEVELGKFKWSYGKDLVSCQVVLGSQERQTTCQVEIVDLDGTVAAALINHSLKSGGIKELPTASQLPSPVQPVPAATSQVSTGQGTVARGGQFTPEVLAFLDLIAYKEVGGYDGGGLSSDSYLYWNGGSKFTLAQAQAGFPLNGTKATGRYQILPKTWDFIRSRNPGQFSDFLPASQDRAAYWLLTNRGALKYLKAGDIFQAIVACRNEWVSLPGGSQAQPGYTMTQAIQYWNQRLSFYKGSVTEPIPSTTKTEPRDATAATSIQGLSDSEAVIKGSKIRVSVDTVTFEFYHQATSWSEKGVTSIRGQGIRWVMNRRQRNKSAKLVSLRQLAQTLATNHKLTLDWQSDFNPVYEHVDQTGITDYQLLLREAKEAGLLVSEQDRKLVIRSTRTIQDSALVIKPGVNLVRYEISDKALDTDKVVADSLLQSEAKAVVSPLTGQLVQTKPDVDSVQDGSLTGSGRQAVAAKPLPGQASAIAANRSRLKRVEGLPSTFVLPLYLNIQPTQGIKTEGFPGVLNRYWLVKVVKHDLVAGTTTLEVCSPVETLDESPTLSSTTTSQQTTPGQPLPPATGSFVIPASGLVTSAYGWRTHPVTGRRKFHAGVDIGNVAGTPIRASKAGLVVFSGTYKGYGLTVDLRHADGYFTRYAHCRKLLVSVGYNVEQGEQIAEMGNTGVGTGVHLHFEVRKKQDFGQGASINPASAPGLSSLVKGTSV